MTLRKGRRELVRKPAAKSGSQTAWPNEVKHDHFFLVCLLQRVAKLRRQTCNLSLHFVLFRARRLLRDHPIREE